MRVRCAAGSGGAGSGGDGECRTAATLGPVGPGKHADGEHQRGGHGGRERWRETKPTETRRRLGTGRGDDASTEGSGRRHLRHGSDEDRLLRVGVCCFLAAGAPGEVEFQLLTLGGGEFAASCQVLEEALVIGHDCDP
jgi:hypothetical protein